MPFDVEVRLKIAAATSLVSRARKSERDAGKRAVRCRLTARLTEARAAREDTVTRHRSAEPPPRQERVLG